MSFDLACPKCGARSGPSVGICPYCKAVMSSAAAGVKEIAPGFAAIKKYFDEGAMEQALALATAAEAQAQELSKNRDFQLLYARILIEIEAPSSKTRAVLNQILLKESGDIDALDYLAIVEARSKFSHAENDPGEMQLKELLKRRADLDLAHFILGAHLFWNQKETVHSVRYLETAVRLRPNFLRAWGCLGAIYAKMNNEPLASKAFQNCLRLEKEPKMRKYFQDLLSKAS